MSYFAKLEVEKEYMKYVEKTEKEQKVLRSKIMDILGLDYEGLYLFFWERLTDEQYDYMVLMSRRCFVLCQLFILFFALDGKVPSNKMKIMSDRALPRYRKELSDCECRIQIVDDILIHGRTIRDICGMFYYTKASVDSYVYMRCIDMECVSREVQAKLYFTLEGDSGQWRELSDKFVRVIHTANIPYTSYVSAFFYSTANDLVKKFENKHKVMIIENTSLLQKKSGIKSVCIFNEVCSEVPIFKTLTLEQCVRIYYSNESQKGLVIPYVFLKRIEKDKCFEILKKIGEVLIPYCPVCASIFCENECVQMLEYKVRLLTCILSNIYWKKCQEKYQLEEKQNLWIDVDTIEKSFGLDVADEIRIFQEIDILDFNNCAFDDIQILEEITDESEKELILYLENRDMLNSKGNRLFYYFQQAWRCDERRAKIQKSRLPGLPVDVFLQRVNGERREILAALVNAWDTGIATANCLVSQDGKSVGCYNAPGEQGYKIVLCRNSFVFSALLYIAQYYQRIDLDDEEYEKEKLQLMEKVIKAFENKYGQKMDDVREIVMEECGNIQAWNSALALKEYIDETTYEEDKLLLKSILKENKW